MAAKYMILFTDGAGTPFRAAATPARPGSFGFFARIIDYPGGMPDDVGIFFGWAKSSMER